MLILCHIYTFKVVIRLFSASAISNIFYNTQSARPAAIYLTKNAPDLFTKVPNKIIIAYSGAYYWGSHGCLHQYSGN